MGRRQERALREYPEIAEAYSIYTMCRGGQLVQIQKEKAGKSVTQFLSYPDGLRQLPNPGGILDQPHRLMTFFDFFEAGEQAAFSEKLR